MSRFDEATIGHIRKSVVSHGFCDPSDWAHGIDELSQLDDGDIDTLITGRLQIGVTREQVQHDREMFSRVTQRG